MDKLSPELSSNQADSFVVVEFHPDVNMAEARALVRERNLRVNERINLLAHQLLVDGEPGSITRLAEWDEIAYIFPASPELVSGDSVVACAGATTELGPVAQYVKVGPGWPRIGPVGGGGAREYVAGS